MLLLYTLTLTPPASATVAELTVEGTGGGCPMVRSISQLCDYAIHCAETHPFTMTVEPASPVTATTWSRVKARFGTS